MQPIPKRKDEDVDEEVSPWADVRKNLVLRDARMFNDAQLNASKCTVVLTKILYLLNTGEQFSAEESLELFFAVTKLFQSPDVHLRRMVYLIIKELRVESDSGLIVVACLSKDMVSKIDLFRANSIRVLAKIMDASMVGQMERFLKQALVDKNPFIIASTLCAGQHLFQTSPDTIKRWGNEITEALNNKQRMVQYHALALLYRIKQHDRLAISKIVSSQARSGSSTSNSPMAQCLLIRITFSILQQTSSPTQPLNPDLLKYLFDCLRDRHYMVMFEAARAITRLDHITQVQLVPAITVLQEMLTSQIPAHRFASVRALSEVVVRFPLAVHPCVVELEHLIGDANRNIATLAITTLLKTGVESNVDRLMKSISGFMNDISDEFKIVLVEAIRTLCLKFPHKFHTLLNFLATSLREEGGFKFKKAIVDAMLVIIQEVKDATEVGLEHFCEFIEDCEFPELSIRILHVLGDKGPQTSNPAKYIRFIFNRVILETASVRCAAVSSLAKFGTAVPALTNHIIILLNRCLQDNDDEVRERAIFYQAMLKSEKPAVKAILQSPLPAYNSLEFSLLQYLSAPSKDTPFALNKHLLHAPSEENESNEQKQKEEAEQVDDSRQKAFNAVASANQASALLQSIPELAELGTIFKSCSPVDLTETETEYVVSCVKHILPRHVVFQFNVTNTLEEHQLENVTVQMEAENDEWEEELSIPEPVLKCGTPGTCFVVFNRPEGGFTSGAISCTLHFNVKEVENGEVEDGKGNPDEYQLEAIEVSESDFMKPGENIGLVEFKKQWEEQGEGNEVVKKYSLGLDSLQAAVNAVTELLGMQPCENSNQVTDGARSHAVNLTGSFFGGVNVLARAGFMLDQKHGVTLKIAVRSSNPQLNAILTNAIR